MKTRPNVSIDFLNDWKSILRNQLLLFGCDVPLDETYENICIKYFNISKRIIIPKPRKVNKSKEFNCPLQYHIPLSKITKDINDGDNLNIYLSKNITNPSYNDMMLNDWGIHHFHLGMNIINGFVERTGHLLFLWIDNDASYLINIYKHGSWTKYSIIETIYNNWPELIRPYTINILPGDDLSETDHHTYRKYGGNVTTKIISNNQTILFVPPGGGYMTDCTSMRVITAMDNFTRRISKLQSDILENLDKIINEFTINDIHINIFNLRLSLQTHDSDFIIVFNNNEAVLNVGKINC